MDGRNDRDVIVFLIRVFFSLRNAVFIISRMWGQNLRDVFPSNEEKCFVQEVHIDMYSENIMVKKSKPSVKGESLASVKGETVESVKEETIASGGENEGFDAVRILMAIGVLFCVISLAFILLRYVLHWV